MISQVDTVFAGKQSLVLCKEILIPAFCPRPAQKTVDASLSYMMEHRIRRTEFNALFIFPAESKIKIPSSQYFKFIESVITKSDILDTCDFLHI